MREGAQKILPKESFDNCNHSTMKNEATETVKLEIVPIKGVKMHRRIGSIFCFLIGFYVCITGYKKFGFGNIREPGPGFIFTVVGLLLMVLSLLDLHLSFVGKRIARRPVWSGIKWKNMIAVLLGLYSYVYLCNFVGFTIYSFLLMLFLFRVVEPIKWLTAVIIAVITAVAAYMIFCVWLNVQVPKGFLGI